MSSLLYKEYNKLWYFITPNLWKNNVLNAFSAQKNQTSSFHSIEVADEWGN